MKNNNKDDKGSPILPPSMPPKEPTGMIIQWQKAIIWHSIGFFTIVVLTWCQEWFFFLHQVFGRAPHEADFTDAAIKTLVIVLVWAVSGLGIYRLVARLNYLERFLHVCAWCRKVEQDGKWVTFEAHFGSQTGNKVSHGICPECSVKFTAGA